MLETGGPVHGSTNQPVPVGVRNDWIIALFKQTRHFCVRCGRTVCSPAPISFPSSGLPRAGGKVRLSAEGALAKGVQLRQRKRDRHNRDCRHGSSGILYRSGQSTLPILPRLPSKSAAWSSLCAMPEPQEAHRYI